MAMVVIAAVAVGMSSMWAYLLVQWHDPAMVEARMGQPEVVATGRIVEPLKSSSLRDADCQTEVDLSSVRVQGSNRVPRHESGCLRTSMHAACCRVGRHTPCAGC